MSLECSYVYFNTNSTHSDIVQQQAFMQFVCMQYSLALQATNK